MTDITETSQTVAAGQLRAFIERIERVEEEIKTLNADKSEIYKELRGVGFDVKAVRQCVAARKLDSAEREERNAIFDLYWEALTGASRVHVHEEPESTTPKSKVAKASSAKSDDFVTTPHDPETGEIIEPNSSDLTSSPETTDRAGAELPSAPATNSNSVAVPAPQAQPATKEAGAEPPLAAPADNSDADVPAFLRKDRQPSPAPNPDCQKPQSCRWSHSQASCAKCANDAAVARQKGRAA